MTTIPVVYRLSVTGASDAASSISSVSKTAVEHADKLSSSFKKVASDVDAVAGKSGAVFGKWASDVFGLVESFGRGGLLGVITAATTAVGLMAEKWKEEEAARKAQKQIIDEVTRSYENVILKQRLFTESTRFATTEQLKANEAEAAGLVGRLAAHVNTLKTLALLERAGSDDQLRLLKESYAAQEQLDNAEGLLKTSRAKVRQDFLRHLDREAKEAEAADSQAHADKIRQQEKEAAEQKKRDAEAVAADRRRMFDDAQENEARVIEKREARLAAAYKRDNDRYTAFVKKRFEDDKKSAHDASVAAEKRHEESERIADALIKEADALEKKTIAERQATGVALAHAVAQTAVSSAQLIAQPIVNELTAGLRELTMVNRDSLELLKMEKEEIPAFIAAKAQAILSAIAVEATGRAIMETGHAVAEYAMGFGMLAIPGGQASAALHMQSAITHSVAATTYATIGGAAGVGAVGLGLSRGSGPGTLFQLTKEEADERNRREKRGAYADTGDSGGGGGGTGSGRGRGGGTGGTGMGGGDGVTVNIVYQNGSIAPADERRAANTVARHVRRANDDAFVRRSTSGSWG